MQWEVRHCTLSWNVNLKSMSITTGITCYGLGLRSEYINKRKEKKGKESTEKLIWIHIEGKEV